METPHSQAAEVLRRGGLVALPTETVYGLGADARNEMAVRRIFAVKGRPSSHPLIVHLADAVALGEWAREVPNEALALARAFWPGPLTVVLPRAPGVLDVVTGGQDTVALRVPRHPLALEVLRAFGGGVAAPSANRFGKVSPTSAEHVRRDLGNEVDLVLDGGPCEVGLESTIVDLSSRSPAVLRPGAVTPEMLEQVLRRPVPLRAAGEVRVPGQLAAHYAPSAGVVAVPAERLAQEAERYVRQGLRVALLSTSLCEAIPGADLHPVNGGAAGLAHDLYARFRQLDLEGYAIILVELPDERGIGLALRDRLARAGRGTS